MSFLAAEKPRSWVDGPLGRGPQRPAMPSKRRPKKPFALRGLGDEGDGLGAVSLYNQPRYGTKAWWQWYATAYLPSYLNQQQVYSMLLKSPFYSQYGLPITYPQNTNLYPYGGQYPYQQSYPYQQQYQYPQQYYQQPYQYQIPVTPPHYVPYGGTDTGAVQCNQAGGIYDAFAMTCSTGGTSTGSTYGTGAPPNVVGQTMYTAVQTLNNNGWNVWLLNQDGISGGVPQDYQPNRVQISVANNYVTSQSVG